MTEDQATRLAVDDGWVLGHESWPFHRAFYRRFGRPMEFREYSHLARQVRAFRWAIGQTTQEGTERVICFVTTYDGQSIAVQEAGYALRRIIEGDSFVTPREAWELCRAFWFEHGMVLSAEELLSLQAQGALSSVATLKRGKGARTVSLCADAIPEEAWDVCRAFWLEYKIRLARRELNYLRLSGGFGRQRVAIRRRTELVVTVDTTYQDRMRLARSIETKYGLTVAPGEFDLIRRQIATSQPVLPMAAAQGIYQVTLSGGQRVYVLADSGKPLQAKRAAGVEQSLTAIHPTIAAPARKRPILTLSGLRPAQAV